MNFLLLTAAVISAVTAVICQTRQYHMLQLNSYFASRYFKWLTGAFSARAAASGLILIIESALLFTGWAKYIPLLIFTALTSLIRCASAVHGARSAKKKLVYTPRIKRMYLTAGALALIPIGLIILCKPSQPWALFSLFILIAISPMFTYIVLFLNLPVVKLISKHYVNDAKRILRASSGMKIIGITGSYGKTSTKFILGRILSEKYNVTVTPESFNTLLGVVRTIREKLKPGTEIFVVEMGAKNIGDIKEICDLVHPDAGIITAVGPQHLDTFKTLENVAKTKFELSDSVAAKSGCMYLNADSESIPPRAPKNSVLYGINASEAALRAENITSGRSGLSFDITGNGRKISIETRLLGTHNVLNILAAAAVAISFGLSDEQIRFAVSRLNPTPHRLELKPFINGALLIDDAYNSNPSGSLEAVRVLGSFEGTKKIIVTPGLVELGDREYEHNYNLGLEIAKHCDTAILVGRKRAIPMEDALKTTDFPAESVIVADAFTDALTLLHGMTDRNTTVQFLNDLPDNYL